MPEPAQKCKRTFQAKLYSNTTLLFQPKRKSLKFAPIRLIQIGCSQCYKRSTIVNNDALQCTDWLENCSMPIVRLGTNWLSTENNSSELNSILGFYQLGPKQLDNIGPWKFSRLVSLMLKGKALPPGPARFCRRLAPTVAVTVWYGIMESTSWPEMAPAKYCFVKKWPIPASFCLFSSFLHDKNQI